MATAAKVVSATTTFYKRKETGGSATVSETSKQGAPTRATPPAATLAGGIRQSRRPSRVPAVAVGEGIPAYFVLTVPERLSAKTAVPVTEKGTARPTAMAVKAKTKGILKEEMITWITSCRLFFADKSLNTILFGQYFCRLPALPKTGRC